MISENNLNLKEPLMNTNSIPRSIPKGIIIPEVPIHSSVINFTNKIPSKDQLIVEENDHNRISKSKKNIQRITYSKEISWNEDNVNGIKRVSSLNPNLSFFNKVKNLICCRKNTQKLEKFIISLNDVSSAQNFDLLLKKINKIDVKTVKILEINDLQHQFLIQLWKELEYRMRKWKFLEKIKINGTILDRHHLEILLYMIINRVSYIKSISFNYNGLKSSDLEYLFLTKLKINHFKHLDKISIKNNPNILINEPVYKNIITDLLKAKSHPISKLQIPSNKYSFFSLDLSETNLDDKKIKKLAIGLITNHCHQQINSLKLSYNDKITEAGWHFFAENLLSKCIGLKELFLCRMSLEEKGFKRICEGISQNDHLCLELIDLGQNNNISSIGWHYFAQNVIRKANSLKSIIINKCGLNDEIIEHLTKGVLFNEMEDSLISDKRQSVSISQSNWNISQIPIEFLDLSENWHITTIGWKNLLTSVLSITTLKKIAIRDCVLNEDKISGILDCLNGSNVIEIDLSFNPSIVNWKILSEFLTKKNMMKIILKENSLCGEKNVPIWKSLCLEKSNLKYLDLSGNNLNEFDLNLIFSNFENFAKIENLILRKISLDDSKINVFDPKGNINTLILLDLSENTEISNKNFGNFLNKIFEKKINFLNFKELKLEECNLNNEKINVLSEIIIGKLENDEFKNFNSISFMGNKNIDEKSLEKIANLITKTIYSNKIIEKENQNDSYDLIKQINNTNSPEKQKIQKYFSLNIGNISLTDNKLNAFFSNLYHEIFFDIFDISKNTELKEQSFIQLNEFFKDSKISINSLIMKGCRLDKKKLKCLTSIPRLHKLIISENPGLHDYDFETILKDQFRLNELNVKNCGLKDISLSYLGDYLQECPKINNIDLGLNKNISHTGLKKFFQKFFKSITNNLEFSLKLDDAQNVQTSNNFIYGDGKLKTVCTSLSFATTENIIESIDLSKNKLSASQWQEISIRLFTNSENLQSINLSECQLNDETFSSLFLHGNKNLKTLDLSGNPEISKNNWNKLAKIILNEQVFRIENLILDNCGLDDKKMEAFIINIDLSQGSFGSINSLKLISLKNNNKFTNIGLKKYFEGFLCHFKNIKEIYLSNNCLDDLKMSIFNENIDCFKELNTIDISGNSLLTDNIWEEFLKKIQIKKIEKLFFSNMKLNNKKINFLEKIIDNYFNNIYLDLSNNDEINESTWKKFIIRVLRDNKIINLNLSKCGLMPNIFENYFNTLLKENTKSNLKYLDISSNLNLSSFFSILFSNLKAIFPEIEELILKDLILNDSNIISLTNEIENIPRPENLKTLDLSLNKILTENGWKLLSEIFLFLSPSLKNLILQDCELTNSSFKPISEVLTKIKLENLDISKNWAITESGLNNFFINVILKNENTLSSLYINESTINDNKIKAISLGFQEKTYEEKEKENDSPEMKIKHNNESQSPPLQSTKANKLSLNTKNNSSAEKLNSKSRSIAKKAEFDLNFKKSILNKLSLSGNKSITDSGWKLLGTIISLGMPNLKNLDIFNCDMDCDSKLLSLFSQFKDILLESLSISLNGNDLSDGLIVLHSTIKNSKIKKLKIKVNNEDFILKLFWNPLNFLTILKNFGSKNKPAQSIENFVFEPKSFMQVFENNQKNKYEEIILNSSLQTYLKNEKLNNSLRNLILINYDTHSGNSLLSKYQLRNIFDLFSNNSQLQTIYLDYSFDWKKFKMTEYNMLNFLCFLPPKRLYAYNENGDRKFSPLKLSSLSSEFSPERRKSSIHESSIQTKLTINGIKAIFAIIYENYNIQEVRIDYDYDSALNQGIAFSLREKVYRWYSRWKIIRFIKFCLYKLLSLFVVNAKHFKFSTDTIKLNNFLGEKKIMFWGLVIFVIFYYFFSLFIPFYYIDRCENNLAWISYYIFSAFAGFTFLLEIIIVFIIYERIKAVYLRFLDSYNKTFFSKMKRRIILLFYLFVSQISHYNLLNDFAFVKLAFTCDQTLIAIIGSAILIINITIWFAHYLTLIYSEIVKNSDQKLNFFHINKFLRIFNLNEFSAVSNILDSVSPYNVVTFPLCSITRKIIPKMAGQSINFKIYAFFIKFLFENTPQIFIKLVFLFYRQKKFGEKDEWIIASLILSLVVFVFEFYKFMSIRPSVIYQGDFDELIKKNKKKRLIWLKELIAQRDKCLDKFLMMESKENREALSVLIDYEISVSRKQMEEKVKSKRFINKLNNGIEEEIIEEDKH